jgi:magnesium chelatase family protein
VPVRHLAEAVAYFRGERDPPEPEPVGVDRHTVQPPDLSDVRGQERARRVLEIAAAGRHNLLLAGPPGIGKTMLARRLPGVLPPLDDESALEVTRIHSIAGVLAAGAGLIWTPPFRAPHHTASTAAIVGGGSTPRPGEATLAHHGVLLLDELPEFARPVLEGLRQPLEDGTVAVARVGGRCLFPARFQLVGTMNLCPCGGRGDGSVGCSCSPQKLDRYRDKLSRALLDRFDLVVALPRPRAAELGASPGEASAPVRDRVVAARARLEEPPSLTPEADGLLARAVERLPLSGRGRARVTRVARTIAALGGSEQVAAEHLAEALSYRSPAELSSQ